MKRIFEPLRGRYSRSFFLTITTAAPSADADALAPPHPNYRGDRILVKPKAGVSLAEMTALHARFQASAIKSFSAIGNLQIVQVPGRNDRGDLITSYKRMSGGYAEHDFIVHPLVEPNDFQFVNGDLWNIENQGHMAVWSVRTSTPRPPERNHQASNVIVAVVDTGAR